MRDWLISFLKKADEDAQKKCITDYDEAIAANADFLLAAGVIVPPVKVGQTVYVPWFYEGQQAIATVKVEEIRFYDSKMHCMFYIDMESDDESFNQSFGGWKVAQSIGKTVFLTREEAERALKGAQG